MLNLKVKKSVCQTQAVGRKRKFNANDNLDYASFYKKTKKQRI